MRVERARSSPAARLGRKLDLSSVPVKMNPLFELVGKVIRSNATGNAGRVVSVGGRNGVKVETMLWVLIDHPIQKRNATQPDGAYPMSHSGYTVLSEEEWSKKLGGY
jgi:hypothetical protein